MPTTPTPVPASVPGSDSSAGNPSGPAPGATGTDPSPKHVRVDQALRQALRFKADIHAIDRFHWRLHSERLYADLRALWPEVDEAPVRRVIERMTDELTSGALDTGYAALRSALQRARPATAGAQALQRPQGPFGDIEAHLLDASVAAKLDPGSQRMTRAQALYLDVLLNLAELTKGAPSTQIPRPLELAAGLRLLHAAFASAVTGTPFVFDADRMADDMRRDAPPASAARRAALQTLYPALQQRVDQGDISGFLRLSRRTALPAAQWTDLGQGWASMRGAPGLTPPEAPGASKAPGTQGAVVATEPGRDAPPGSAGAGGTAASRVPENTERGLMDLLGQALHPAPKGAGAGARSDGGLSALMARVDKALRSRWKTRSRPDPAAFLAALATRLASRRPELASRLNRVAAPLSTQLPGGPYGMVRGADLGGKVEHLLTPGTSARVTAPSILALNYLTQAADLLEAVSTPAIRDPLLTPATLRLLVAAYASALTGAPVVIDTGLLLDSAGSAADKVQDRIAALKTLYPALRQLARDGLLAPVQFLTGETTRPVQAAWKPLDARWAVTGDDILAELLPAHATAFADATRPMSAQDRQTAGPVHPVAAGGELSTSPASVPRSAASERGMVEGLLRTLFQSFPHTPVALPYEAEILWLKVRADASSALARRWAANADAQTKEFFERQVVGLGYDLLRWSASSLPLHGGMLLPESDAQELVDLPPGPFGAVDPLRIDATVRSTLSPAARVRGSTAFYMDLLDVMATTFDTMQQFGQAAMARLIRGAIGSATGGTPFVIDVDGVRSSAAGAPPSDQARVSALASLYPFLRKLVQRGDLKSVLFLSSAGARPVAEWQALDPRWSTTADDLFPTLFPDAVLPASSPAQEDPELMPVMSAHPYFDGDSANRQTGEMRLVPTEPTSLGTLIKFPPLDSDTPTEAQFAAQNEQLRTLDWLMTRLGLAWQTPDRLPAVLTLDGDTFSAGSDWKVVLARREPSGRWTIDEEAVSRLGGFFQIAPPPASTLPVSQWRLPVDVLQETPKYLEGDEGHTDLRIYVALEDHAAMDAVGGQLMNEFKGRMVWVQLAPDGTSRVVAGGRWLADTAAQAGVHLFLGAHPRLDRGTKSVLLATYTPQALSVAVGTLLKHLRPDGVQDRVEHVALVGCNMASPFSEGDFGGDFLRAGEAQGWAKPGLRAALSSDVVVYVPRTRGFATQLSADHPMVHGAAGRNWEYWIENGETRRIDRYPDGGRGTPADQAGSDGALAEGADLFLFSDHPSPQLRHLHVDTALRDELAKQAGALNPQGQKEWQELCRGLLNLMSLTWPELSHPEVRRFFTRLATGFAAWRPAEGYQAFRDAMLQAFPKLARSPSATIPRGPFGDIEPERFDASIRDKLFQAPSRMKATQLLYANFLDGLAELVRTAPAGLLTRPLALAASLRLLRSAFLSAIQSRPFMIDVDRLRHDKRESRGPEALARREALDALYPTVKRLVAMGELDDLVFLSRQDKASLEPGARWHALDQGWSFTRDDAFMRPPGIEGAAAGIASSTPDAGGRTVAGPATTPVLRNAELGLITLIGEALHPRQRQFKGDGLSELADRVDRAVRAQWPLASAPDTADAYLHAVARQLADRHPALADQLRIAKPTPNGQLRDGPFGLIDPARVDKASLQSMGRGLDPRLSASTIRSLNYLAQVADLVGAIRDPAINDPLLAGATLSLIVAAHASGLTGTPLVIDTRLLRREGTLAASLQARARINSLTALYPGLRQLVDDGFVGPIRFLSDEVPRPAEATWTSLEGRWAMTDDDILATLLPEEAGAFARPAGAEAASAEEDDWRLMNRLMIRTGLDLDTDAPLDSLLTMPTNATVDGDVFRAGGLVLARRDPGGRWRIDELNLRRLDDHMRLQSRNLAPPVSAWRDHVTLSDTPAPTSAPPNAGAQPPRVLRIFVAVQDHAAVEAGGGPLMTMSGGRGHGLVGGRGGGAHRGRGRAAPAALDAATQDTQFRLIIGGHGGRDFDASVLGASETEARLIAGYTPDRLSQAIARLLPALRPSIKMAVAGIRIPSCTLESPVATDSFGAAFAEAAIRDGWSSEGVRTTTYSDGIAFTSSGHLVTNPYEHAPFTYHAARQTWQSWVENGQARQVDKYPEGGEGLPPPVTGGRRPTERLGNPGEAGGGATPAPAIDVEARLRETGRVKRVLAALAQLPAPPKPRADETWTLLDDMKSAVIQALLGHIDERKLARLPGGDYAYDSVDFVANGIIDGLIGDRTGFVRAHERLVLMTAGAAGLPPLRLPADGVLARANSALESVLLIGQLAGHTTAASAASGLLVTALLTAAGELSRTRGAAASGIESRRLFGRAQLVASTVMAAASQSPLYVDLSPGIHNEEEDIELFRARGILRHLMDVGALKDVVALSLSRPQADVDAGRWRTESASLYDAQRRTPVPRPVFVSALRDEDLAAAMPQVVAAGPGEWQSLRPEAIAGTLRAIVLPDLQAASARLQELQAAGASDPDGERFLALLADDLDGELARLRRGFDSLAHLRREWQPRPEGGPIGGWQLDPAELRSRLAQSAALRAAPSVPEALTLYEEAREAVERRLAAIRQRYEELTPATDLGVGETLLADRPLAVLTAHAPGIMQSFDRETGEIRLWTPTSRVETVLRVRPLSDFQTDGTPARAARLAQDADVRTAEALIVEHFLPPLAGLRPSADLRELPRSLSLDEHQFRVNDQVIATWRPDGAANRPDRGPARWTVDPEGLQSTLRAWRIFLPRHPSTLGALNARRTLDHWHNLPRDLPTSARQEPRLQGPLKKLRIIVDLGDRGDSETAAELLVDKRLAPRFLERGESVARIRMTRPDALGGARLRTVFNARDLAAVTPDTEIVLDIVGRSDWLTQRGQVVSGWDARQLFRGVSALMSSLAPPAGPGQPRGATPKLRRVALVVCDLQSPSMRESFGSTLLRLLSEDPVTAGTDLTVRTGQVHVVEIDLGNGRTQIAKLTSRLDANRRLMLRHQHPGDTLLLIWDPISRSISTVDRYANPDDIPAGRWVRPATELRLLREAIMDEDAVPMPLVELFTNAQGEVDEARLFRVLQDPAELSLLERDLEARFKAAGDAWDTLTPTELLAGSMAGKAVSPTETGTGTETRTETETASYGERLREEARSALAGEFDIDIVAMRQQEERLGDWAFNELLTRGYLRVDEAGAPYIDPEPLVALIKDGNRFNELSLAAEAFFKLPRPMIDRLWKHASPQVARLLGEVEKARTLHTTLGELLESVAGHGVGVLNTVIGVVQLAQGWGQTSSAIEGLSITQMSGIVTSPLMASFGRWLTTLDAIKSSTLATGIARCLAGGLGDSVLAACGLLVIGLQWDAFQKSVQGLSPEELERVKSGYEYQSLLANTGVMVTATFAGLMISGVNIAVAVGGGIEAAGEILGAAFAAGNAAALPVALLTIAVMGAVNVGLWAETYGDYIRPTTNTWDLVGATLAKFFGVQTKLFERTEKEKSADEAARAREAALLRQWPELMAFQADLLSKLGYTDFQYPLKEFPVRHATFQMDDEFSKFSFILQDHHPRLTGQFGQHRRNPAESSAPASTAWIGLDGTSWPKAIGQRTGKQYFQLVNATGQFIGGAEDDLFDLGATSRVLVDGRGGDDEVRVDATGQHVVVVPSPDYVVTKKLGLTMAKSPSEFATTPYQGLSNIERVSIRGAVTAAVTGGPGDDRFDVQAGTATLRGGAGRNTYVLHAGNRVVSTSDDAIIWTGGVSATIELAAPRAQSLLVSVDVLHESLSFRRDGANLAILAGPGVLTLERFFDRPVPPAADGVKALPGLFIVDAVGTHLTPIAPERLGTEPTPSGALAKHLYFGADTPRSRRTLTSDQAQTRLHLGGGSGDFRAAPMTAMPMDLALDIPLDRLRYRRDGQDLLLIETPPAGAQAGYTPTRLRLPGYATLDWASTLGRLSLWATASGDAKTAVKLRHPATSDPDEGPLQDAAAAATTRGATQTPTTAATTPALTAATTTTTLPKDPASPTPTSATDAAAPRPVKRGSRGSDTYDVKAGETVTIDNRSGDEAVDVLRLEATPAQVTFKRVGDDLVIEGAGATVTVLRHAVDPAARHLSLELTGGSRFTLPTIDGRGTFVHAPVEGEDVLATMPGRHLVDLPPSAPWWPLGQRRPVVRLKEPAAWTLNDGVLEALSRDGATRVSLVDGRGAWNNDSIGYVDTLEDRVLPSLAESGVAQGIAEDTAYEAAAIDMALSRRPRPPGLQYDAAAVRAYLRMKGLPQAIADSVQTTVLEPLDRLRALLAATVNGKDWLPADYLDGYAGSSVDTPLLPALHGPLLRQLAARKRPWAYAERALAHGLTLQALDPFDSWAFRPGVATLDDETLCARLDTFNRLLRAKPDAAWIDAPDAPELLTLALRVRGRPADVAASISASMVAVQTLDEAWVAGMHAADVREHDVLKALWNAKVSPQDVVLGNANRQRYEQGDRRSLITVTTSGMEGKPTKHTRYFSREYLKLDGNRYSFTSEI